MHIREYKCIKCFESKITKQFYRIGDIVSLTQYDSMDLPERMNFEFYKDYDITPIPCFEETILDCTNWIINEPK